MPDTLPYKELSLLSKISQLSIDVVNRVLMAEMVRITNQYVRSDDKEVDSIYGRLQVIDTDLLQIKSSKETMDILEGTYNDELLKELSNEYAE